MFLQVVLEHVISNSEQWKGYLDGKGLEVTRLALDVIRHRGTCWTKGRFV